MTSWTYHQKSGALIAPNGEIVYHGYSGAGKWKSDPESEALVKKGPIPRGNWLIDLRPFKSPNTGRYTLALSPVGHSAHGRTAFRIHGDSISHPGTASEGCIIVPRGVRELIVAAGITSLEVVA